MHRNNSLRQVILLATAMITLLATLLTPATVLAQADAAAQLVVTTRDSDAGVVIAGATTAADAWTAAAAVTLLPTQPYGGYELPLQTYTVLLEADRAFEIELGKVSAAPLADVLTPAPRQLPPVLDWEPDPNLTEAPPQLPNAPVFVLRQGKLRGLPIAVIAVSPIFEEGGVVKVATDFTATAPGATLFDLADADAVRAATRGLRAEPVNVPVNSDALRSAHKLVVTEPGVHEVTFAELGGVSDPSSLRLMYKGSEVALEIGGDRLRFYAATPGDRWNDADYYWLSSVPGARARITTAVAAPAAAPGKTYTRGEWIDNLTYDSIYAGPDGDHWFNADMRTDPSMSPLNAPTATVAAPSVLPLLNTAGVFTVGLTVWVRPPDSACLANLNSYRLNVVLGNEEKQAVWNPAPGCQLQHNWTLPVTMTGVSQDLLIKLMPSTHPLGIKLDRVSWQRPVRLDFRDQGADFWTDAGAWSYTWNNLPGGAYGVLLPIVLAGARPGQAAEVASPVAARTADAASSPTEAAAAPSFLRWRLYDVTNPLRPFVVPGTGAGFNQPSSAVPRHYVLADLSKLAKPTVIAQPETNLGNVQAADAIYIGPAQFADALQPLFELRRSQGYAPLFVDVAAINDVYGYGYVSALAIRNFLRHRSDWQNPNRKISVVLVGDGSYDPHGYQGLINENLVTPFMADVDPFIREAPCEPCFAQLNGDDPVTGDNKFNGGGAQTAFFAADVWLGRFPVRNAAELTTVVEKLINYETQGGLGDEWRKRHVILADNYILELDANQYAKLDDAGDFGTISDAVVDLLPRGTKPTRIYYDPAPNRTVRRNALGGPVPAPGRPGYFVTDARGSTDPWRIVDTDKVHDSVVAELSKGAGLVVYNGHSNHFQYARTYAGPENRVNYLMNTNTANFLLTNQDKYFIMLAMTCYTASYARPTNVGVLDEILFRRPAGGAVAVWGPAGLTVAHGHDRLQTGFMKRLWAGPAMDSPLGALVEAGYDELLTVAPVNLDAAMTFLLMGDPLTRARVYVETFHYLPLVNR
jgi:hypothetical protein